MRHFRSLLSRNIIANLVVLNQIQHKRELITKSFSLSLSLITNLHEDKNTFLVDPMRKKEKFWVINSYHFPNFSLTIFTFIIEKRFGWWWKNHYWNWSQKKIILFLIHTAFTAAIIVEGNSDDSVAHCDELCFVDLEFVWTIGWINNFIRLFFFLHGMTNIGGCEFM